MKQKNLLIIIAIMCAGILRAQVFVPDHVVRTPYSTVKYDATPVAYDDGYAYLLYDKFNANADWILLQINDKGYTSHKVKRTNIKGDALKVSSMCLTCNKFYIMTDNRNLAVFSKNSKGDYMLCKTQKDIPLAQTLYCFNDDTIVLMADYNYSVPTILFNTFSTYTYSLLEKEIKAESYFDVGKSILLSYLYKNRLMDAYHNKVIMASATTGEAYVLDNNLLVTDSLTIELSDKSFPLNKRINQIFTDSILEQYLDFPKRKIDIMNSYKLDAMEHIIKTFWVNDDVIGYAITNPHSAQNIVYGFYSLSQGKEIYRGNVCNDEANGLYYNNILNRRIQIYNNCIINVNDYIQKDEAGNEQFLYQFDIYKIAPLFK